MGQIESHKYSTKTAKIIAKNFISFYHCVRAIKKRGSILGKSKKKNHHLTHKRQIN
jgi:hypothetical protein